MIVKNDFISEKVLILFFVYFFPFKLTKMIDDNAEYLMQEGLFRTVPSVADVQRLRNMFEETNDFGLFFFFVLFFSFLINSSHSQKL